MNERLPRDYDDLREAFYAVEKERDELRVIVAEHKDTIKGMVERSIEQARDGRKLRALAERYKAQLERVREGDLDDAIGYLDDWDENTEEADYTGEIRPLLNHVKQFINKINPEIENWKRVVTKLTHEKAVVETRCEYYEKGLRLIVKKCIECPDTAQFADAMLNGTAQLHTESVVSWDKDCDECHGMGFIKGWIYNNNQEIPCPKCNKNWGNNG